MSDDKDVSIMFDQANILPFQERIINILCYILVILGVIGNVLGLLIFSSSRRSWRISSVYVYLATSSLVINVLCVARYACVLHSTSRNILRELIGQKWWACKIYEFSFAFRVISSWITLFWMFERLMCTSKRSRTFYNRWNSSNYKFVAPIIIVVIFLSIIIIPPVYMFQPQVINDEIIKSTRDMNRKHCELPPEASAQWQKYFHENRVGWNHSTIRCFFSELTPTVVVILLDIYIIYYLIRADYRLQQFHRQGYSKERSRTTSWMHSVLIVHSCLFFASLVSHVIGHFTVAEAHEAWWVLLAILINCSLNFYIYCLSGKAFRNEIRRFIYRLQGHISHRIAIYRRRRHRYFPHENLLYEMNKFEGVGKLQTYRQQNNLRRT